MTAIASRRRTAMVTFFHTDGDRITPDDALVQHLDPGAFDKAELDQAAFELDVGQRGAGLGGGDAMDHAEKPRLASPSGNCGRASLACVMACHFNRERTGQAQRPQRRVSLERL